MQKYLIDYAVTNNNILTVLAQFVCAFRFYGKSYRGSANYAPPCISVSKY